MAVADFHSEARSFSPTALLSLFRLDASNIGGEVYDFTTSVDTGQKVSFGGVEFTGVPIQLNGLEVTGGGAIQTPTLAIGNTDGIIQPILNYIGNLEGARLTRWRTFGKFLDGQPTADGGSFYGPDVYIVDRKSKDSPEVVEWELRALIDQQGMYIGRTMIRDTCLWRYRVWNPTTGNFDYSKAQCPYTGGNYFDEYNQSVLNASDDKPARNLECCRKRFGARAVLPFGGFPGIVRGI